MDKFKKLDASNDEILFMTRQDVLGGKESIQKNDDWDVFGSLRDMQLEVSRALIKHFTDSQ